ncbi:MAG: histidine--tRNA ligase [Clostridia bacterium]|nr:histidine--tRNA ligase [Clostridia bacterium]
MKTKTVKGMNDYLPSDAEIRDYLQSVIIDTYKNSGFEHIITPIVEDAENLDKSEGGDNLNLIFKIMKRGAKLQKALEGGDSKALSDMGLRYDLTLPLCRYFANNRQSLMLPFKAIQADRVYRAENSQKGRLREFVQCDIDIIGSKAPECEIELILTTAEAIRKIGIGDFKIKINDRSLLRAVIEKIGFAEESFDSVCITFDKLDKIGAEGVKAELLSKEFDPETVERFCSFFSVERITMEDVRSLLGEADALANLEYIMSSVNAIAGDSIKLEFDISLVRGQGYYTGTVFEIHSLEFSGAIGGGGRYDNLIGKFIGESIPAVGFSIGFERIFAILKDRGSFKIPDGKDKVVVIYDRENYIAAQKRARELRKSYDVTLCERTKKTGKQLSRYAERGYRYFFTEGQSEELQPLN